MEQYASQVDELQQGAPYTSKDIDVLGDQRLAQECAVRLTEARVHLPNIDDHATPNAAKIIFHDHGVALEIDVMRDTLGVRPEEIREMAIPVELRDRQTGAPTGTSFHVMHPVHCMESRVYKVLVLNQNTTHATKQLRASVLCAREFIQALLGTGRIRDALRLQERIFRFVMADHHGQRISAAVGIDPFDAVVRSEALPEAFRSKRYPQMQSALAKKRRTANSIR